MVKRVYFLKKVNNVLDYLVMKIKAHTFALAIERELEYMPVTHGVTGSSPVRTAINIENQCFAKQTPDFTPKNVKSGVF